MNTKHTPGPWVAYNQDVKGERPLGDDGVRFWDIAPEGPYRGAICTVHGAEHIGGITREERDANALLISALPEMLHALHWIAENAPEGSAWRDVAIGAVAKATGGEA